MAWTSAVPAWVLWLAAGVLLLAALGLWVQLRHKYRMRRYVLAELKAIQQRFNTQGDQVRYLQELNLLLRRIAVRNFYRSRVEGLSGDEWLDFLDWSRSQRDMKKPGFREGCGRVLDQRIYEAEPELFDPVALDRLVRLWIKRQT